MDALVLVVVAAFLIVASSSSSSPDTVDRAVELAIARKRAALMAPALFPQLYPDCGRITHPPLPQNDQDRRALAQGQNQVDLKLYDHLFSHYTEPGVFLEIGAVDGKFISNTYFFEHGLGWRGILVEPQPANAALLMKANRPRSARFTLAACSIPNDEEAGELELTDTGQGVAHSPAFTTPEYRRKWSYQLDGGKLVKVPCIPLQYMIESTGLLDIDLFSLDVEGGEMAVLETVDLEVTNIRAILVEMNDFLPDDRHEAIRSHLTSHGFINDKFCRTGDASFCAESELFINPRFEERKVARPPPPIQCDKYRYEDWTVHLGYVMVLNTADQTCHAVSLVARNAILESAQAIAASSCQQMRQDGPGLFPQCPRPLVVDISIEEDCISALSARIHGLILQDSNHHGAAEWVGIEVLVNTTVTEFFVARSKSSIEGDAHTFCRGAGMASERCVDQLSIAAHQVYSYREQSAGTVVGQPSSSSSAAA